MILLQPIILANEFVQHAIMIVLFGLVLAECISIFRQQSQLFLSKITPLISPEETKRKISKRKRDLLLLLAAVFFVAFRIILEFFVNRDSFLYHVAVHWPIIFAVLSILWIILRPRQEYFLRVIFIAFAAATLAHIVLDILYFLHPVSWDRIIRAVIETGETLFLYFFVLIYFIRIDEERTDV